MILLSFALASSAWAGKNWVGGASGAPQSWNTAANWSPWGVPGTGDNPTIPGGRPFYPVLTNPALNSVQSVTIQSGASLGIAPGGSLVTTKGAASVTVQGTLAMGGGVLTVYQDITGSGAVVISGGTLKIGHDWHLAPANSLITGGTVEWTGEAGSAGPGGFPGGAGAYSFFNVLIDPGVDPGFANQANAFVIGGDWINNGAATLTDKATTTTVTFNGSSSQTIGGSSMTTFYNLTINNSAGVSLSTTAAVNGTLTLTAGLLTTGTNQINLPVAASVSGASQNSYVNGSLQKSLDKGANQVFAFPVGDAYNYAPITATLSNVTQAGSLTACVTGGDYPGMNNSGVSATRGVNCYWTLSNAGLVVGGYSALFNFSPAAVDVAANPSNFIVARKDVAGWTRPTVSNRTATSLVASGMTNFGDYVIGEPTPVAPTITGQPRSQSLVSGGTAQFSVQASGTGTVTYQWLLDGNPITGATNSSLSITNVQSPNAGTYSVVVDNGSPIISASAVLTVSPPTPPGSLSIGVNPDGSVRLSFQGIAGLSYQVQATDSLLPITWVTLNTMIADPNGLVSIMDEDAANHPIRFYRAALTP